MKDLEARANKSLLDAEYFRLVGQVVSLATTCAYMGFPEGDKDRLTEAVTRLADFEKDNGCDR